MEVGSLAMDTCAFFSGLEFVRSFSLGSLSLKSLVCVFV
jgi:hypothetical protein